MALLNNGDEEMTSRKRRRRVSERAEDDGLTVHELIEGGDGLTYKLDLHTANSENVTKKYIFTSRRCIRAYVDYKITIGIK